MQQSHPELDLILGPGCQAESSGVVTNLTPVGTVLVAKLRPAFCDLNVPASLTLTSAPTTGHLLFSSFSCQITVHLLPVKGRNATNLHFVVLPEKKCLLVVLNLLRVLYQKQFGSV